MLELYQYDLSEIWDQDLDASGEYGYAMDRFWKEHGSYPYVALVDGHYAGFALVDGKVKLPGDEFWMDQFFVMKKYRRRTIGLQMAEWVIRQHPGNWQIGEMTGNFVAQAFWRKTIGHIVGRNFEEHVLSTGWWQGHVQRFTSQGEHAA